MTPDIQTPWEVWGPELMASLQNMIQAADAVQDHVNPEEFSRAKALREEINLATGVIAKINQSDVVEATHA